MNLLINILVTLDMLTVWGNFVHLIRHAQIGQQAYYQQISDLAFKALKACTPWDPSSYFHSLTQQSEDLFIDMFAHVNEVLEQRVDQGPTGEMSIKQLVWEGLNAPACNVVTVVHNEDIHK